MPASVGEARTRSTTHPVISEARHAGQVLLATFMPIPSGVVNDRRRDRAVDTARLTALVVVMFGHCALLLATIDSSGVRIGNLLGEIPAIVPVTWVLQVMPLFFVAGGAAGAYGWRDGTAWGSWLFARAQRLCRPVFWYLSAWTAALPVVRATLGDESADGLGRECVALLWFLGVYLVVLAFVPVLIRLRTGHVVALTVVGLLATAAAVDGIRFAVGTPESGVANFLIVWLIPVVIGVAYTRQLIPVRAALIAAVAAFSGQIALAIAGTYEVPLVVTGVERVSNVSPPTLLLALHCTWMSCAFVAASGPLQRWAQRPSVWRAVAVGNGGAMTLYLWHIAAIAMAAFGLNAIGLDAYDVHAPRLWALLALRAVLFAAVIAVLFLLLSPLEHRRLPWWDAPVRSNGVWSAVAGALICVAGVALILMAKNGLAGVDGWAALGGFVAGAVAARLVIRAPHAISAGL